MLDEFDEWNLIMAHYFGLLAVSHSAQGEAHPSFKPSWTQYSSSSDAPGYYNI